ncbi:MAG: DUF624 domain-containing protein [Clostridia bacterium]|nr:DUF624 domain-containing protein [Clostridia bacterium]
MNQNDNSPKKKRTSIFFRWMTKDGKGVDKDDVIKIDDYNVKNFFKLFGRRIRQLMRVNWIYIFGNFPIFAFLLAISGNFSYSAPAPTSQFYPIFYGISTIGGVTPDIAQMGGINALMGTATANSWGDYLLYGISALIFVTFGIVNTGCAYIMRNIVRGEHIFLWQDFKSAVKQNLRQSIILGAIDAAIIFLSYYSIRFYLANYNQYFIMFYAMIAVVIFYFFIRSYMYTLLVTFELSIFKILKNSFIFAMIAFGRNFLGLLIVVALLGLTFILSTLFLPIGIILILMILVSACVYATTYLTYPKIKAVMIDPFYPNYGKEEPEEEEQ